VEEKYKFRRVVRTWVRSKARRERRGTEMVMKIVVAWAQAGFDGRVLSCSWSVCMLRLERDKHQRWIGLQRERG
jgi:hypothetical protein